MIWGMTLHPGVEYCREVTKEEHLTLASLDCRPLMNKGVYHPLAHLIVKVNNCEHVLCYLEKGISHQQSLDFIFQEGDNLALSVEGTGIMHITGYSVKHSMYEDIKHDGSVIPPVKAELDETQYDMDSTISLEYLPETNGESFASQESQQRGRHLQQNSDKVESDEETDDESGLNHCERTGGTIVCEGREGLTSSLQISAEDMEQLLRANRTEIDFYNQNLNESLRVVLRNAKKFHADSEGREMECEITDDVEMSKTDSNSTLQERGLQDKCRSSGPRSTKSYARS